MLLKLLKTLLLIIVVVIQLLVTPIGIVALGIVHGLTSMWEQTKYQLSPKMLYCVIGDALTWIWHKRNRPQERADALAKKFRQQIYDSHNY